VLLLIFKKILRGGDLKIFTKTFYNKRNPPPPPPPLSTNNIPMNAGCAFPYLSGNGVVN